MTIKEIPSSFDIKLHESIIIGDPHISFSAEYNYVNIYSKVFEQAVENNKKYAIILGDIFDDINKIGYRDLNIFLTILRRAVYDFDLKVILLLGNHDISGVRTEKTLFNIYGQDMLYNVFTISTVYKKEKIYFLPFFSDNKKLREFLFDIKKDIEKNEYKEAFIISHNDFYELYPENISEMIDEIIKFNDFFNTRKIKLVSGHIHKSFINENIICVGNFLDRTYNDKNLFASFITFDENNNPEVVYTPYNISRITYNIRNEKDCKQMLFELSLLSKVINKKISVNLVKEPKERNQIELENVYDKIVDLFSNEEILEKMNIYEFKLNVKVITDKNLIYSENDILSEIKNSIEKNHKLLFNDKEISVKQFIESIVKIYSSIEKNEPKIKFSDDDILQMEERLLET